MRRDDPAALAEFLNDVGLERHCATLLSGRWRATLGGLLVLIEERPVLLARLKELGVSQLSDRQCLANALARLQRSGADSSVVLDPAVQLPIFHAPGLVSAVKASDAPAGHPSGTHGLLLAADGTASHVNSHPPMRSDDGSHCWITHGTRLDGPIVAAVTRLASRLGRAVFLPFSDEDPGLATPHSLHSLAAASPPEGGPPKRHDWLAAMAHAFGPHVLVLTTALHRGVPSHPRVRLMPCFDSWAASTTELPSAAARARPFASRTDRAVWRGVPSGSQALVRDGASIRSRVLDYCAGKPWADCQYGGGMMHGDNWLTLDELAAHKVILAIDGNAWASTWEWGLSSGSVIVSIGVWHHAASALVAEGEHYLAARADLSDLEEVVSWVFDHPVEAASIAQRAKDAFARIATPKQVLRGIVDALTPLEAQHDDDEDPIDV